EQPKAKEKAPEAAKTKTAETPKPAPRPAPTATNGEPAPRISGDKFVVAGPATRRLARKLGVDLAAVPGSGPRGRVIQDDVIAFAQRGGAAMGIAPTLPDFGKW